MDGLDQGYRKKRNFLNSHVSSTDSDKYTLGPCFNLFQEISNKGDNKKSSRDKKEFQDEWQL